MCTRFQNKLRHFGGSFEFLIEEVRRAGAAHKSFPPALQGGALEVVKDVGTFPDCAYRPQIVLRVLKIPLERPPSKAIPLTDFAPEGPQIPKIPRRLRRREGFGGGSSLGGGGAQHGASSIGIVRFLRAGAAARKGDPP